MLAHYCSSLEPYRETFQTGLPILTYHKLGPCPARVRLKGMYLSHRLFQRQLMEFQEAGFQTGSLDDLAGRGQSAAPGRIVITFDDGFQNVLAHGLGLLARRGFHAIQFLVADLLGKTNEWEQAEGEVPERLMDAAAVRDWLAAGHEIGSHTNTHPWLTRIPVPQAREEIIASRKRLEDSFQVPIRHFCYPYGDWNDTIRAVVVEAGYATACTTEPGMNLPGHDPHGLRRFTARYPTRNLKALWQQLSSG